MRGHPRDAQSRIFGEQVDQHWQLAPHDPLPVHTRVKLQVGVEPACLAAGELTRLLYLVEARQQWCELMRHEEGNVRRGDRSNQENRAGYTCGAQADGLTDCLDSQSIHTRL